MAKRLVLVLAVFVFAGATLFWRAHEPATSPGGRMQRNRRGGKTTSVESGLQWLARVADGPSMGRIAGFDGLRALAAIAVVCTHLGLHPGLPGSPLRSMVGGYQAVHLFFALSGFLITALLLHEQREFGRVSIRDFYARRAFRIVPLYVVCLGVVALLHFALGGVTNGPSLIHAATFTYNFMPRVHMEAQLAHTWSVAVEEHFYLLWPVVFWLLYPRHAGGLLLAAWLPA